MQLQQLKDNLCQQYPTVIAWLEYDELSITVAAHELLAVATTLKASPYEFVQLTDLAGVDLCDYPTIAMQENNITASRFMVVYHLLSIQHNLRVRLKSYCKTSNTTALHDNNEPSIASVVTIWQAANWYEREAYDLFGINFIGHPELTRLFLTADFTGHPLRKDFPIAGTLETYYDQQLGTIQQRPVALTVTNSVPKIRRHNGETSINLERK